MTSYRTIQGDAWDTVAFRLWGRERLAHHLMAANPEHLDVVIFPAGVELAVPDIVVEPETPELPPWMQ